MSRRVLRTGDRAEREDQCRGGGAYDPCRDGPSRMQEAFTRQLLHQTISVARIDGRGPWKGGEETEHVFVAMRIEFM
jgi:hypothetical protein